ncbi:MULTISPECIES: ergothioneine biosynthesis protein EgtB [Pseudomonas]|uniref:Ergothioneine biosynthesis protein EgtB n=1 Tax=Pseudomonas flexibilis TaxID=706570 RepID=A0A0B3BX89_9PSED|nr:MULTISPECIES: ergothioneine biosynthesis protein EgtB [Pseudomonas]KHO65319.1 hypothetical protein PT85_04305 [Pseudomonas flexibilis]SCX86149.1 ergothioneine biosynthesis protein EgtB [Pseudomonas flexibilis]SIP91750.1 ergothioneine biosynthesis protein EgtB [Pseudomonas flexibilis]
MPAQALHTQNDPDVALQRLRERFRQVRATSEALCAPLAIEDYGIQGMPDASPPKWHLAHTTWFFETFLLLPYQPGYRTPDPRYDLLFNSYYLTHGQPFPRPQRGLLSRPTVAEVLNWRRVVNLAMEDLLDHPPPGKLETLCQRLELGLQHEQQHQELLLMDLLYNFSLNPLAPAYRDDLPAVSEQPPAPLRWHSHAGGLVEIGHAGDGFAFDCERPRHKVWLEPFRLASRPVSNADYLAFLLDGGYSRSELWLSDGWATLRQANWQAPLYWRHDEERGWREFTLTGLQPLNLSAPVCHLSFFEADAYARWADARLPSEAEWEAVAQTLPVSGHFLDAGLLRPQPSPGVPGTQPAQLFGDVWEWTASAFLPYPGFQPLGGSLGEYNGKFMCGQQVLRGGCCVTPPDHLRASYRNFFYPHMRWAFSGLRLARDETA